MFRYVFALLSAVLLVSGVVAVRDGAVERGVLSFVMAGFLGYLMWKQARPKQEVTGSIVNTDSVRRIRLAASEAFWLTLSVMVLQSVFEFLPTNFVSVIFVLTGLGAYFLFWLFFRWRGVPSVE